VAAVHCGDQWIDAEDLARIDGAIARLRDSSADQVVAGLLPGLSPRERATVAAHCSVGHTAVLVFPPSLAELRDELRAQGLAVGEAVASVVVRERLSRRYGRRVEELEVGILRAPVTADDGGAREIEIFALAMPPGSGLEDIAKRERAERHEEHLAFKVDRPDAVVLAGLRTLLLDCGGLVPDGGGYNSHEDGTVLYFRAADRSPTDTGAASGHHRRLELHADGHHLDVLAAHLTAPDTTTDPATRLLELMTGAWTTQAIAVAAELELADALPCPGETAAPVARLAERVGADPDALHRLLRYLATLGLVSSDQHGYRLTETGGLLRKDAALSLRPLALLYGGPFYRSFADLGYAVRTGEEAFRHVFGQGHFDHFAADPELLALFDGAMAAGAPMFQPLPDLVDFSAARTVVDIGGGIGELLGRVLTAHPRLHGVLFERPQVIEEARVRMDRAGLADRCTFASGDFTRTIPTGGDVYLLSRVLHDWDDQRCLEILRRCAEAMPDHADLVVVERLLPADDRPSLAVAWDVHMLCNVGGRERTEAHFRGLLAEAGFTLLDVTGLPLDGFLLRARRSTQADKQ
jgi:hypothetical protein